MKKLDTNEVAARLSELPGWTAEADVLSRTFEFADYYRVMAFVNAVAYVAHTQDHHPDLEVHYGKVRVSYTTHDAGGLTAADFDAATVVHTL